MDDKLFFIETKRVLLTLYILLEISIIPHTVYTLVYNTYSFAWRTTSSKTGDDFVSSLLFLIPVELLTSSLYPTSPLRFQKFPQMFLYIPNQCNNYGTLIFIKSFWECQHFNNKNLLQATIQMSATGLSYRISCQT